MQRKLLIFFSFVIASVVVIATFVTARTYVQLGIAILLYLLLVYCVYEFLLRRAPRGRHRRPKAIISKLVSTSKKKGSVVDIDRRGFLKLVGAAGISFLIFSIFGKRAEVSLLERLTGGKDTGSTGLAGKEAGSDSTDGYQISEIEDNGIIAFYGFTDKIGFWFIMREDMDEGSYRYARGDSKFEDNWSKRKDLEYDYFHEVF